MEKRYITLSKSERKKLEEFKDSDSTNIEEMRQTKALLMFDNGSTVVATAEKIGTSFQTLKKWRDDFELYGLESIPYFKKKMKNNNFL